MRPLGTLRQRPGALAFLWSPTTSPRGTLAAPKVCFESYVRTRLAESLVECDVCRLDQQSRCRRPANTTQAALLAASQHQRTALHMAVHTAAVAYERYWDPVGLA